MDIPQARSVRRGTLAVAEIQHVLARHARGEVARRQLSQIQETWTSGPDHHEAHVDILFYDGDLTVDGDFATGLEPWIGLLLVRGDLRVDGLLQDSADPESLLVVTGDLRAANFISEGWLEVHGNVEVDGSLLFLDNECSAEIYGDLRAGFVFTKYHQVRVHGRVDAPLVAGDLRRIESPHDFDFVAENDPRLLGLLRPEVLVIEGNMQGEYDEDWWLDDVDAMVMRNLVCAGHSPLRGGTDPA